MKIINIGILAHVDAGKTTLTESLLYASGAISEPGSVEKGTTRTDTMFLERQRGVTIEAVRVLTGPTNGRKAAPGTIRGDYSMSFQENIVHASDSPEAAEAELKRFFKPEEIFDYKQATFDFLYANDEY